ncbi:MAG: transposase [Blastocatellia bacterium]|nr:transposase [Blastocatellia bacterium]
MKRDYIEFQDRSVAKGYLITFRCYGTWLHGDERGSVDRRFHNKVGAPKIKPNTETVERKRRLMKGDAVLLDSESRQLVETAIREVCKVRGYRLIAINVRTNHVHVVVNKMGTPERIMDSFKAYATRALRTANLFGTEQMVWSRHGSTRYLWTDDHIDSAVEYVVHGQGGEMPRFD